MAGGGACNSGNLELLQASNCPIRQFRVVENDTQRIVVDLSFGCIDNNVDFYLMVPDANGDGSSPKLHVECLP